MEEIKSNVIGFHSWVGSLAKKGFPRTKDNCSMNIWQLYEYWETELDKKEQKIYLDYGKRLQ